MNTTHCLIRRTPRAPLLLLAFVLLLGGLAGCGNKGDLVLPDPPAEPGK